MKRFSLICLLAAILALPALPARAETPAQPAWRALPADTAIAIRMPELMAGIEALREHTKFGAVLLNEERLATWQNEFKKVLKEEVDTDGNDAWSEMMEQLEELGLADIKTEQLLAGSAGAALVLSPRENTPFVMMLGWLEPGEETAAQLQTAIERAVEKAGEEAENEALMPIRVDREVAG
ncbi:MAG: hypothetical protein R3336_10175, partial [Phycisphaeraceae bacterium]|nr:hypothetical protein [Phycisphaeraceae bacterium]